MYDYKKYIINGRKVTCVFDSSKPNIESKIEEAFKKYVKDNISKNEGENS